MIYPTTVVINTDGGSRGNPGAAACAFVVFDEREELPGKIIFQQGVALGIQTNNEAEYQGVRHALLWIKEVGQKFEKITWKLDSKLVVEQLSRRWKIKEPRLQDLATECWKLMEECCSKFQFKHVLRDKNALADALLNKTLDQG